MTTIETALCQLVQQQQVKILHAWPLDMTQLPSAPTDERPWADELTAPADGVLVWNPSGGTVGINLFAGPPTDNPGYTHVIVPPYAYQALPYKFSGWRLSTTESRAPASGDAGPGTAVVYAIQGLVHPAGGTLRQQQVVFPAPQPVTGSVTIDTSGGAVTVQGNVGVTNTVNIQAGAGVTIPISGSVQANVQNATIDTQSTVVNEQVGVGLNYLETSSISVPAAGSISWQYGAGIQLVPAGQSISTALIQAWLASAGGIGYTQVQFDFYLKFADGTMESVGSAAYNAAANQPFIINTAAQNLFDGQPVQFNYVVVGVLQSGSGAQTADTVTVRFAFSGQATPVITSQNYPGTQAVMFEMPESKQPTSTANGVPLPVQLVQWQPSESKYVGAGDYPRKAGQFNTTIDAGASATINTGVNTLWRYTGIAMASGAAIQVLDNAGNAIGFFGNTPSPVDWSQSGQTIGGNLTLYNYSSTTSNISFNYEYD